MLSVSTLIYIFTSAVVTLFPVMNPIGNGFIVNSYLGGLTEHQRVFSVRKIALNALLIGFGTLILGHFILMLFGLAIPIIQLGGGLVICSSAWSWLSGDDSTSAEETSADDNTGKQKDVTSKLFYPIAFPLCFGPGSISVVLALMATVGSKAEHNVWSVVFGYLAMALAIVLVSFILYVCLKQSPRLTKKLGNAGNMIINKMLSFFMLCIGLQILVQGIATIFGLEVNLG